MEVRAMCMACLGSSGKIKARTAYYGDLLAAPAIFWLVACRQDSEKTRDTKAIEGRFARTVSEKKKR